MIWAAAEFGRLPGTGGLAPTGVVVSAVSAHAPQPPVPRETEVIMHTARRKQPKAGP